MFSHLSVDLPSVEYVCRTPASRRTTRERDEHLTAQSVQLLFQLHIFRSCSPSDVHSDVAASLPLYVRSATEKSRKLLREEESRLRGLSPSFHMLFIPHHQVLQ